MLRAEIVCVTWSVSPSAVLTCRVLQVVVYVGHCVLLRLSISLLVTYVTLDVQ